MAAFLFQKIQESYKENGWIAHHEQELEFEEDEDDSPPAVTLSIAEPDTSDDKWVLQPISPHQVRSLPPQVYWRHVSAPHRCLFATD